MADKKQKETSYYTSSEKNLVPSKEKSVSEKLYGKVKEKPTYKGKVEFKNLPKKKDSFWQLGKSKERITAGDLIKSVTGRGGLNKGGLIKGKPKLAKKGWK